MRLSDLEGVRSRYTSRIAEFLEGMGKQPTVPDMIELGRRGVSLVPRVGPIGMSELDAALAAAGLSWSNGTQLQVVPDERAVIRASAMNLSLVCPGSAFLAARLRQRSVNFSTVYTNIGHIGHGALQTAIENGPGTMLDHLSQHGAGPVFVRDMLDFWKFLEDERAIDFKAPTRCEAPMEFQAGEVLVTGTRDMVQESGPGLALVADWKFYNDPSMLPPIEEDLQMLAYAVGTAAERQADEVEIRRYLVYYRSVHVLVLRGETLEMAAEVVREEAESAWAARATFNVGAQCRSCLVRQHCDVYQGQGKSISTQEIAPYAGGTFTAPEQVLQFLLAAPLVEERIAAGKAAARAWVLEHGAIGDPTSGEAWGPRQREQDEIVDASGCLMQLMKETDQVTALGAAKTTKGALEGALKEKGMPPAGRREFLERLRELGVLAKKQVERWEWK